MITMAAICCVLILMDIVCGIAGAARNKELCSSIMRDGLYNKFGELMLLVLAIFINEVLVMAPFDNLGIPPEIAYCVAIYIAVMEIMSIIENICKINPELPFAKILLMFNLNLPEPVGKVESGPNTESEPDTE